MKTILFATPSFCIPILNSLFENTDLLAVVTTPDSAIKKASENLKIDKVFIPNELDKDFVQDLEKLNADIFVVASYGKILPSSIIDLPKNGSINVHPSPLPKYRGASPVQQAILNGDSKTGVSIIKMDKEMDHGPILKSYEREIEKEDTFETLVNALFEKAAFELPNIIDELPTINPQIQDDTQATFCKTLTKQDGYIDLDNLPEPEKLERMTRAFYPWPGVWTKYNLNDKEIVIKLLPKQMIQVEGKNPMTYKDFMNGYPRGKEFLTKLGLS